LRKYNSDSLVKYLKKLKIKKNNKKKIFVDALGDPEPWHVFHNILLYKVMNKLGYSFDIFIGNNQEYQQKIYNSFTNKFITINKIKEVLCSLPQIIYLNLRHCKIFFSVDKIFHFRLNNLYVGDLIYDDYLRRNYVITAKKMNFKFFLKINEAFFYYVYYNKLLKSDNNYEYVFLNHISYVRGGLLARLAIQKKIKVLLPMAKENGFYIRKHYSLSQIYDYSFTINPVVYNKALENEDFVLKTYNYFEKVMCNDIATFDKENFDIAKNLNSDIAERNLILSDKASGKKIVLIAAHALIDAVCGYNGENSVYKDYYLWLINTVELCLKNENIITYVKLHPREYAFTYSPKVNEILGSMNSDKLRIWSDNLDLKMNIDLIDVMLTVRGSVSWEFPSFGVPCVVASKNNTLLFGENTTIYEYNNEKEYEFCIKNIHLIEKLDEDLIKKSRLLYYLYYHTNVYLVDKKYMPKMDEYLLEEYIGKDTITIPKHDKYKDEIYSIIEEKLELFNKEQFEFYEEDIIQLLSSNDYVKLADVQFMKFDKGNLE